MCLRIITYDKVAVKNAVNFTTDLSVITNVVHDCTACSFSRRDLNLQIGIGLRSVTYGPNIASIAKADSFLVARRRVINTVEGRVVV